MKHAIRKSIHILLALCMILTLCVPAAAGAGIPGAARVEDTDPAVVYTNGSNGSWAVWEQYHFVGLAYPVQDQTVYPAVSLTFTGTGVAVYGQQAGNGPIMSATIDGEPAGVADFYGDDLCGKVYEKLGLANQEHVLTLTFTKRTNSPIANRYASLQAAIDYFEVVGPLEPHSVTVVGGTAAPEVASAGEAVTVTATPKEGMLFTGWTSEPAVEFADKTATETTFVMPNAAVTVTANFSKDYPAETTFYVDSEGGDDSNDGTNVDAPWKTLDQINALTLKPGDRVLLKAGSVFEGQSLSLRGSGSVEQPIIVDMYSGDTVGAEAGQKPIINANGIAKADFYIGREGDTGTTSRPGVSYGVHIKNVSYIHVNNLEITNTTGSRQLAVGVVVEAESGQGVVSGVHLDGLYVHDVYGTLTEKTAPNGGIFVITTAANGDVAHPTRYDDVLVQNCTVSNVSRTGISVGSSHSAYYWERHPGGMIPDEVKNKYGHTNVVIRNNYVEEPGGDAIVPQFCIAPLIEYNISNGASQNTKGNYSAMYNAAIWPWRCEDALFQFNEAYGTISNGDGQAYDCDSSRGTTYQYNYSHDNEGGFILLCQSQSIESTVRYNISQNDHDSLFLVSNTTPAEIYNNTFYIGENLTRIVDGGSPSNLRNNIFYNSSGKPSLAGWGNFTYSNNLYYGFENLPNDVNKIVADPMFVDAGKGGSGTEGNPAIDSLSGYALQAGSPAINKGVLIENNGGRDYQGNPISGNPDIGAMEFISVRGVELDKSELTLSEGEAATLTASISPDDAANKAVTWSTSDANVATVENGVVTAMGVGTATITVTTEDGGFSDTCEVTVLPDTIPVTGVELDKTKLTLRNGQITALAATVKPDDATNKAVTWSTSNAAVVTVKDGVVIAVGEGTATITVTTEDGGFTDSCVVLVKNSSVVEPILPPKPSAPALPLEPRLPFTDVPESAWYYNNVLGAWKNGLINGMTDTLYQPNSTLTVAQAIKLAAALHQMENEGKVTLSNGSPLWYSTYVNYAVDNGIIEEAYEQYTAAQMDSPVSRAEFVHIFHGAMNSYTEINQIVNNEIPDIKATDKYGAEIYEFYRAGILTGSDSEGTFHPANSIKRSEAAAILIRMYDASQREHITLK